MDTEGIDKRNKEAIARNEAEKKVAEVLETASTKALVEELEGREGVSTENIPMEHRALMISQRPPDDPRDSRWKRMIDGPAIVLIVID